jgi:hypothetical protein
LYFFFASIPCIWLDASVVFPVTSSFFIHIAAIHTSSFQGGLLFPSTASGFATVSQ